MIADGVYLDLPLADYLRDPALSGSAFKKLLSDPAALMWERPENPLWEERASRPKLRGSAAHCAILEGLDAYEARYAVKPQAPEGALVTCEDMRAWLGARADVVAYFSERDRLLNDARVAPHLTKQGKLKLTGSRDELIERVRALDPSAPIWDGGEDALAGREALSAHDDAYVRMLERFVRSDAALAPLITGGLAEVSIFWTEGDLRFKARIDYLTSHTICDLKTFGQPPLRGRSLREHCVREATYNGYDLQAAHNARAVQVATERYFDENSFTIYPTDTDAHRRLANILADHDEKPPVFRWLFLRMGGAPTGVSIPFRQSDGQWQEAERQIADACATYRELRERFGDGLWLISHGEQEIQDLDWPLVAIRGVT